MLTSHIFVEHQILRASRSKCKISEGLINGKKEWNQQDQVIHLFHSAKVSSKRKYYSYFQFRFLKRRWRNTNNVAQMNWEKQKLLTTRQPARWNHPFRYHFSNRGSRIALGCESIEIYRKWIAMSLSSSLSFSVNIPSNRSEIIDWKK